MALFHKIKKLFSEPEKPISTPASGEPDAEEPLREEAPQEPEADSAGEPDAVPGGEEPAEGSRAYFLSGLGRDGRLLPDGALPEDAVASALEEIRARLEPEDPDASADAEVRIFSDKSRMTGFAYCLAPAGEGAHVTEEDFARALDRQNIVHGTDREILSEIARNQLYHRLFVIARGTAPVRGKDGQVTDHFARAQEIRLQEDEKGNVDYKNMNLFQSIRKGDVICDLTYPEDGTDGRDITGRLLPAEKGLMPPIPKGKNTSISADGLALTADEDGDISFHSGFFRVEPKLVIPGNVDNSTGNIQFAGDVVIQGEIRRGFQVTAGGKLTISGLAEGAVLSAGDDIILEKGMRGNGAGSITTRGSVYSCFLEQAKVFAEGDVRSDVIINCDIQSGGNILAVSGKGILMGGTLKASGHVEAKRIGSRSETNTTIKIGVPIRKAENIDEVRKKLKADQETLDKITKNYNYLARLDVLPDKHKDTFDMLSKQKMLYEELVSQHRDELYALEHQKKDYSSCHVRGEIIYAVTDITLNNYSVSIRDSSSMCKVYYSKKEDQLVTGTF